MSYRFPDLTQIKTLREKLKMTQGQLGRAIGLSANMIAQIETGRAAPSYRNMKRIFDYFGEIGIDPGKNLSEVCTEHIQWLHLTDTVEKAISMMEEQKFDCIPIRDDNYNLKGKITTLGLAKLDYQRRNSSIFLREILEESPPTVPHNTPVNWVIDFLHPPGCVLITKKGVWAGIVVLWDLVVKKSK